MKKKSIESNKKFAIAFILSLIFLSALILWSGLKKKPETEKEPPKVPEAAKNISTESSSQIFFASNGRDSVYKIKKGDKWSVIWNGQEGKEYDFVSNPVFSSDGNQLAYSAELNGQAYVVVNNTQEIYAYMRATNLIFSADGQVIAFVASQNATSFVVISSAILPAGSTAGIPTPVESDVYAQIGTVATPDGTAVIVLSDNGEHVAFTIVEDGQVFVVVDGVEGSAGYDSISNLLINEEGEFSYIATDDGAIITVVNNVVTSVTNPPTSNPNPTTETPEDSDSESDTPTNYDGYKYKISTDKDINLEESRTDAACTGECNF